MDASILESQMVEIVEYYRDAIRHSNDLSKHSGLCARCLAAVERVSGSSSQYMKHMQRLDGHPDLTHKTRDWVGVVESLLHDFRRGYLKSFRELAHGEVFSDYLEMASHLNMAGFKDAASVISGSTLESHLRQLCNKHGIAVDNAGKPKKADTLNSELAGARVYGLLDQKSVLGWLDLRNNAAHGNYTKYTPEQVTLHIDGIRNFIARIPA